MLPYMAYMDPMGIDLTYLGDDNGCRRLESPSATELPHEPRASIVPRGSASWDFGVRGFCLPFERGKSRRASGYDCYIAMEAMALIEIDGLPFLIAWWIFPWRTVSHNQMVNGFFNGTMMWLT